jgi:hypothetical protein
MQPLEFQSKQLHTYNPHEGEPRDYNNPQILHNRVQHELLLQTKFEFIHKQELSEFNSAGEINYSSNNDTRYHNEART